MNEALALSTRAGGAVDLFCSNLLRGGVSTTGLTVLRFTRFRSHLSHVQSTSEATFRHPYQLPIVQDDGGGDVNRGFADKLWSGAVLRGSWSREAERPRQGKLNMHPMRAEDCS